MKHRILCAILIALVAFVYFVAPETKADSLSLGVSPIILGNMMNRSTATTKSEASKSITST